MEIIRKFKKLPILRFLELVEVELKHDIPIEDYFAFADELKMRKLESISEGEIFKIKRSARNVEEALKTRAFSSDENSKLLNVLSEI